MTPHRVTAIVPEGFGSVVPDALGRMLDLPAALQRHFGHTSFRAGQEELVRAVLDGRDVLAVMPTGSGKSLGFQLPALLLPGTTLVVSPLISLMKDQVDELTRRDIRAAALHSMLPSAAQQETLRMARAGRLQLLYVAPERFASEHFLRVLSELPVARFTIDEAHCVSAWGHDFRPDYRRLREAASRCRRSDGAGTRPPIAAFTATATPEVRADIIDLLGLSSPRTVISGFDRPNIELRVRPVSGENEKHRLLQVLVGQSRSLVYAATRRKAEAAAAALQDAGVHAAVYHAGLTDAERTRSQDAFAAGVVRVVCATNAFGMGIDRPDVEVVVHTEIPGSLEAYYQEIGRAGRDGRAATATLLWHYADVKTREFLIDRSREDPEGRAPVSIDPAEVARRKALDHKKLRRMVAYAETAGCLRATILRYFGDPSAREPCGSCSNCLRRTALDQAEILLVRKILSGVARAGERYGRRKIATMLVGRIDELPEPLTRLSTTGLLRHEEGRTVERWIDASCAAGLLSASPDQYRTLSLTKLGRDVMAGRVVQVEMAAPLQRIPQRGARTKTGRRQRRGSRLPVASDVEQISVDREADRNGPAPSPDVVAALRAWRLDEARRRAVPAFVVLHDRTLEAIAVSRPRSLDELQAIPGIGPGKLAAHGVAILAVVEQSLGRLGGSE